ncbi:MAG: hypothetical protein KC636_17540 [Myxococcales bacterium]|nr:hypothetical protein [Myxococcales bacterium]
MALTNQEISSLSEQVLAATLNGDRGLLDALLERVHGDADTLGVVANSVVGQLAENGVSVYSPVGRMVGALSSSPDIRLRFLCERDAVMSEFGLIGDQMRAIDLDDKDMEAIQGAGYTNP